MNERPIIFSTEMVRAILDGRKTQTRRVIKTQPIDILKGKVIDDVQTWVTLDQQNPNKGTLMCCRYGQPGDVLWVRETWQAMNTHGVWWHEVPRDERSLWNWAWTNKVDPAYEYTPPKWLPSIHMPKAACRLRLEVKDVRVERITDITEKDALAEGIKEYQNGYYSGVNNEPHVYPLHAFQELWDSINDKRGYGWRVNPWVWVIEFTK